MKFACEINLLKALTAGDGATLARQLLKREIDLPGLAEFLYDEHLGEYFLGLVEEQRLFKLLPGHMRNQLLWLREDQRKRNKALRDTFEHLEAALGQAGIRPIVLKGLPLAERYWNGADRRFSWDLDLLVREADREVAIRTLREAGYSSAVHARVPSALSYYLSHAMEFFSNGVSVDLHWRFRKRPGYNIDYQAIWSRATDWQGGQTPCPVLSAEDNLLMLLLGIAQDAERGHCHYRKIWDVYLWLRAEPDIDWAEFLSRRECEGVAAICLNMLALCTLALDCESEFPALHAQLQKRASALVCSSPVEVEKVLGRSRQSLANRLWFARLQPVPAWRYLAWWTLTAPMRYLLGRSL